MRITGILAEYDPFHCGHLYHLSKAKEESDGIVVLLSGHLVQRGTFAKYDKWSRAKAALLCGADLVLELPSSFCCASAERFASSAVSIFRRMGCVQAMSFGSESGDIDAIQKTAEHLKKIEKTDLFQKEIKQGNSYPKARQIALNGMGELLSFPNNTLAVEYCKAIEMQNAKLIPKTIKRVGAQHDSMKTDKTVSSSYLRAHENEMEQYLPKAVLSCFNSPSKLPDILFLSQLRKLTPTEFAALPDVSDGLEHRLFDAAQNACSLAEFYSLAKSKCHTHSRLRRISIYALLGITKAKLPQFPEYARVLGFTSKGRQILQTATSTSLLLSPDFLKISKRFPDCARWDSLATDLFFLGTQSIKKCGEDYRRKPINLSSQEQYPLI